MKLKNRLALQATLIVSVITSAASHSGQNQSYGPSMMWSDGSRWMHNAGHMTGYNMWGMGWFGLIVGLAFWTLVILGIIYLYQQVTEKRAEEQE
jgi:hypothetical protein